MSLTTDTRWTPCSAVMDCRVVYDHNYHPVAFMDRYSPHEGKGYYKVRMLSGETSPELRTVTACLEWVKERLA